MPYVIAALLVLLADQISKYLVTVRVPLDTGSVELIPGILTLRNIHNYGAAFGILKNARWFFLAVTVLLLAAAAYAFAKRIIHSKPTRWLAVLVLAGALGNAIDRLIHGYVVDMFQFAFLKNFAVFNVADIFITCGTILFCILILFEKDSSEQTGKQRRRHILANARSDAEASAEIVPDQANLPDLDSISLDNIEEEVSAVFDAVSSDKTAGTAEKPKASPEELAKPVQLSESLEEAQQLGSSEKPFEEITEPEQSSESVSVTSLEQPEVPSSSDMLSEESVDKTVSVTAESATDDTTPPPSEAAQDITESEPASVSQDEIIELSEEEEEVFTLADILAEFSDD